MKRETFTDFDAFRATNPQLDGEWLINGGRDWYWSTDSLAVGDCGILRCYSGTGLITARTARHERCSPKTSQNRYHQFVERLLGQLIVSGYTLGR